MWLATSTLSLPTFVSVSSQCLAEEQGQETVNQHLPAIRNIIYGLLSGLKQKQAAYKRLINDRNTELSPVMNRIALDQRPLPQQLSRVGLSDDAQDGRGTARSNTSMSQGSASPASVTSPLPTSKTLADRPKAAGGQARPPPPDAFRPTRMRAAEGPSKRSVSPNPQSSQSSSNQLQLQNTNDKTDGLVRHQLSDPPRQSTPSGSDTSISQRRAPTPPPKPTPPRPDRFSRDSFGNPRAISRFSADSDITTGSPVRSPPRQSPKKRMSSLDESLEGAPPRPSSPFLITPIAAHAQSPSRLDPSIRSPSCRPHSPNHRCTARVSSNASSARAIRRTRTTRLETVLLVYIQQASRIAKPKETLATR